MEKTMNKEEMEIMTSVVKNTCQIWVEVEGKKLPIRDYDFELENNRIVLKTTL